MSQDTSKTDGELLAAHIRGDQEAFARIFSRHASLVFGVAQRVLGNSAEAEEVAQAVFLLLVRKARGLTGQANIAGWLHRSSWYAATVARRNRARRAEREREAATMRQNASPEEKLWNLISPRLDAALAGLPAKQRAALAACYLERRTQEEVAREMGVPRSTINSWCRRGLAQLRRKLGKAAGTLSATALGAMLVENGSVEVPASLVAATVSAIAAPAAGGVALLVDGTARAMTAAKLKMAAFVVCAATLAGTGAAVVIAGLPAGTSAAPLAGLPSVPGPHIARIKALGDNAWLNLGRPAADSRFGRAEGRAYGTKMAFASDLRGAFLYGAAGMAGLKPDGRYRDDLFFYDINAHRWICVYPGTDPERFTMTLDENQFEITDDGQHLPVAMILQGHEQTAYDPEKGLFSFMACPYKWRGLLGARRKRWLGSLDHPAVNGEWARHPWFYDVRAGRWSRRKVSGPGPGADYCGSLVSLPGGRGNLVYRRGGDFWLYEHAANTWRHVKPDGPSPDTSDYDGVSCFDAARGRLYVFNRNKKQPGVFRIYDLAANAWIDPAPAVRPDLVAGCLYGSTEAMAHFDSANRVVILRLQGRRARKPGIYVYDPGKNRWTAEPVTAGTGGPHGFYDPELNAHFFFDARDRRTNPGVIRVWRYRRASR